MFKHLIFSDWCTLAHRIERPSQLKAGLGSLTMLGAAVQISLAPLVITELPCLMQTKTLITDPKGTKKKKNLKKKRALLLQNAATKHIPEVCT